MHPQAAGILLDPRSEVTSTEVKLARLRTSVTCAAPARSTVYTAVL